MSVGSAVVYRGLSFSFGVGDNRGGCPHVPGATMWLGLRPLGQESLGRTGGRTKRAALIPRGMG